MNIDRMFVGDGNSESRYFLCFLRVAFAKNHVGEKLSAELDAIE
jgi:hypothetical protein